LSYIVAADVKALYKSLGRDTVNKALGMCLGMALHLQHQCPENYCWTEETLSKFLTMFSPNMASNYIPPKEITTGDIPSVALATLLCMIFYSRLLECYVR